MNLELFRISSDYFQYNTHTFETIWPFILYLFNNWVRHQVQMMSLSDARPLFGPDEFMAPNPLENPPSLEEVREAVNLGGRNLIHDNDYDYVLGAEHVDVDKAVREAKQEYDEILNFSSEIEFDERFDFEQYRKAVRPDSLIDRSAPSDKRVGAVEHMKNQKQ